MNDDNDDDDAVPAAIDDLLDDGDIFLRVFLDGWPLVNGLTRVPKELLVTSVVLLLVLGEVQDRADVETGFLEIGDRDWDRGGEGIFLRGGVLELSDPSSSLEIITLLLVIVGLSWFNFDESISGSSEAKIRLLNPIFEEVKPTVIPIKDKYVNMPNDNVTYNLLRFIMTLKPTNSKQ